AACTRRSGRAGRSVRTRADRERPRGTPLAPARRAGAATSTTTPESHGTARLEVPGRPPPGACEFHSSPRTDVRSLVEPSRECNVPGGRRRTRRRGKVCKPRRVETERSMIMSRPARIVATVLVVAAAATSTSPLQAQFMSDARLAEAKQLAGAVLTALRQCVQ